MKKKLVSVLLCAVLVMGITPVVFAQGEPVAAWDGTADTSWYDEKQTQFEIDTAEALAGLSALVNEGADFSEKTVRLNSDIDLSGHPWVSIGTGNNVGNSFRGTFDGQSHSIYNMTSVDSLTYAGLFGCVTSGAVIKNLGVMDAHIVNPAYTSMGILAGWANGAEILHCYTTGTIQSAHEKGGFRLVGGLIGQCTAGTSIVGCYSTATVESLNKGDASDSMGGLVGQWENATDESMISDCWFGGKMVCEYPDSAVGGILGANFDFDDDQPGVTIQNCFVSTTDITCVEPENITWIAAVVHGPVTNCYWPVNDSETGEPYAAVVKLIVDWDKGEANADPDFDPSVCGEATTDFSSESILAALNQNAASGMKWVAGIHHPTLSYDGRHIGADYKKVEDAKKRIPKDLSVYTDETRNVLDDALKAVDTAKNITEQDMVDGYVAAIEQAIAALKYKGADYKKVEDAKKKIPNDLSVYTDETRKALDDALKAVDTTKNITEQDVVDGYAAAIEQALKGLVKKPVDPSSPETGDTSNRALWIAVLFISGGAAIVLGSIKKRREAR